MNGLRKLNRAEEILAYSALAMGAYVLLSTVGMVVHCWSPMPFWDQWGELVSGRNVSWSWMFSQLNEHRILFPRLIFLIDYWLTSETYIVNFLINVIFQGGWRFASSGWLVELNWPGEWEPYGRRDSALHFCFRRYSTKISAWVLPAYSFLVCSSRSH